MVTVTASVETIRDEGSDNGHRHRLASIGNGLV